MKIFIILESHSERMIRGVTKCPDLAGKICDIFPHLGLYIEEFDIIESFETKKASRDLSMRLTSANMDTRARNALRTENIHTLADLILKTEKQLLKIPNFGRKSLREVKEFLSAKNLTLKD